MNLARLAEERYDVGNDGELTTAGDYIHRYGFDLASNRVSLEKDFANSDPDNFAADEAITYTM